MTILQLGHRYLVREAQQYGVYNNRDLVEWSILEVSDTSYKYLPPKNMYLRSGEQSKWIGKTEFYNSYEVVEDLGEIKGFKFLETKKEDTVIGDLPELPDALRVLLEKCARERYISNKDKDGNETYHWQIDGKDYYTPSLEWDMKVNDTYVLKVKLIK